MLSPNFEVFRIPANYNPNEPQWSNVVLMENSQRIFQRAYEAITSGDYDIVVLDEINMAVYYNFIETNRLVELLAKKPEHVEVILTGRYARNEIIEIADIVTDMREVKHPLRAGMESRLGIDY